MAVHYYDEDNIDVGKSINCKVVVNHTVELTQEEKDQARKDAIKRVEAEAYNKLKLTKKTNKSIETTPQPSLFDF